MLQSNINWNAKNTENVKATHILDCILQELVMHVKYNSIGR